MADPVLFTGESPRSLDDRHRLSLPTNLLAILEQHGSNQSLVMVKEQPGAISLWPQGPFEAQLTAGVDLLRSKIVAGRMAGRTAEVQQLGRLLSTRHRVVPVGAKGRIVIPEGFREFLGVQPGEDAIVVGAAVCIEVWRASAWLAYLNEAIPGFGPLFDQLTS